MNIKEYISRIDYTGSLTPEITVLKALQEQHLLHIPFENLDIHYGTPIELDVSKFYKKIVKEKRGGFCYELNGLFQSLLKKLGFNSKIISARIYDNGKGGFGEEYDHLAIIVELKESEYLVDVGFGKFTFNPLKIELNKVQKDPRGDFIIERVKDSYIVSNVKGKERSIEYKFTNKERTLSAFKGMCDYHQTNPNSHFTQKKLISKPTNKGRITITGNTLKITEGSMVQKNIDFQEAEYGEQLKKWFNIDELGIKMNP